MIDIIKNADLKENKEELLKNMKMLRHTVANMLGSKSFLKDIDPGAQNGVITVYGEQFPIYVTSSTLAADGLPEITDDIYDEDNYLSLVSDDDLLWYALVEHLAHQADLLQADNNKYSDELVDANEEIDKLNLKLAEEIKARQGYEESLKQLRDELTAANNEINELEEDRKEANKKCSEYVKEIDKLTVDNKRLSERVKTLVIEKTNRDDTAEKVSDPKDKYLDMDELQLLTKITELENENEELEERLKTLVCKECIYSKDLPLNTRIAQLEEKLKSTETELTTAMNANGILKTQIAALKDEKRKEENKEFTITINVKKHDDETDINIYKTEIDKLTREVDHLRKENDKIYSILNDAVKVVRNRNKQ